MYKEFFGLKEYPFNLTPDPKFLVSSPGYNELLAGLYYGIEMAKGLMVLSGEVGTGKTTALRWIIRRLDASVLASYIFNPHLSVEEFYYHLAEMLGVTGWENKSSLLRQLGELLADRHSRGLRSMLIVDEAHELSDETLEEIRLLLNFESDSAKHLQIILTGQPELTDRLRQPNLRQLKQRVAFRCKMPILPNVAEVKRYVEERLRIAGAEDIDIFSAPAIECIFQHSAGIPRQVNNLCDNALLAAYAANTSVIGRSIIQEAADNLDMLPDNSALVASDTATATVNTASVLTPAGRGELLEDPASKEIVRNESRGFKTRKKA